MRGIALAALAAGVAFMAGRGRSREQRPDAPPQGRVEQHRAAEHGAAHAGQEQPSGAAPPSPERQREREESDHRSAERRYWGWSIVVSGFAAVATIAAAAFAAFALYLSWQAVIETRRQANAADAALVAADRPWIEVIGLSVVWVEVSGLGVSANLAVRTKNTGRSPALRAFVDAEIVLDTQTNEVGNQAVAMCNRVVRDRDRFGVEGVVFPDGTRTMPLLRNIDPREIGRAWRRDLRREGRPFDPRAYDDGAKPKSASFAIVGCADYTFPSQRATGQTSFVYSLARNCGDAKLELPCDFDLAPARNYSGDEIISEANDFYGFAR